MQQNLELVWNKCLERIKDNINSVHFKTFFLPIVPVSLDKNEKGLYVLTIQVQSQSIYEFIEENFIDLVSKTLNSIIGPNTQLIYRIKTVNQEEKPLSITLPSGGDKVAPNVPISIPIDQESLVNPFAIPGLRRIKIDSRLSEIYKFENFIEGKCNRFGISIGMSIAKEPGQTAYNPFFLHGKSGFGKTHLAQAIGLEIKKNFPDKNVLYLNANDFLNQFTDHVRQNKQNDFMNFYQMLDILIFDDLQFLAGKEKTQDAFFHIFNHLQTLQKQIIITCDRSLSSIEDIHERLLSRFRWGIATELEAPDYETRLAIIKHRAQQAGINEDFKIDENIFSYIASHVCNPREMTGILNTILTKASHMHCSITSELVENITNDFVKHTAKKLTIDYILNFVANYFGITPELIKSKTRISEIVLARHIVMYLSKKLTDSNLKTIGYQLGNKDHSTVIHAMKKVDELMEVDKKVKIDVENLEKKLIQ